MDEPALRQAAAEFLSKVTGGVIKEIDQLLALPVREFRFRNTVNTTLRCQKFLESKGLQPEQLSGELRDIVPLLENASLEDRPELQDLFAKLLAASLTPEFDNDQTPKYHEIMKGLSPLDAKILQLLFDEREELRRRPPASWGRSPYQLRTIGTRSAAEFLGVSDDASLQSVNSLYSQGLVSLYPSENRDKEGFGDPSGLQSTEKISLTPLGKGFMQRIAYFDTD